jgi:hypothetical protein
MKGRPMKGGATTRHHDAGPTFSKASWWTAKAGRLRVVALLTGPGALGPRLGSKPGRWVVAIWRRLRPDADPSPGRILVEDVEDVGSAVTLRRRGSDYRVDGFERWVLHHVVERIPERPMRRSVRRLSDLPGHPVVTTGGQVLGRLNDVRLVPVRQRAARVHRGGLRGFPPARRLDARLRPPRGAGPGRRSRPSTGTAAGSP